MSKSFWCPQKRRACVVIGTCHDCDKKRVDNRLGASARGYDANWRKVRAEVLTSAGIPETDWPKYVVDHRPPYNPAIEPDHRKYQLVPMLKADHSRKTVLHDQNRSGNSFGKSKFRKSPKKFHCPKNGQ